MDIHITTDRRSPWTPEEEEAYDMMMEAVWDQHDTRLWEIVQSPVVQGLINRCLLRVRRSG